MAAPLKPTDVFRLAATCAEDKCPALRRGGLPAGVADLQILPGLAVESAASDPCRHPEGVPRYSQEGGRGMPALSRVTTVSYVLSPRGRSEVSGRPVYQETIR